MFTFLKKIKELDIGQDVFFIDQSNELNSFSNELIRFTITKYSKDELIGLAFPLVLTIDENTNIRHIKEGEGVSYHLPFNKIGKTVFFERNTKISTTHAYLYKCIEDELTYGVSILESKSLSEIQSMFIPYPPTLKEEYEKIISEYSDNAIQNKKDDPYINSCIGRIDTSLNLEYKGEKLPGIYHLNLYISKNPKGIKKEFGDSNHASPPWQFFAGLYRVEPSIVLGSRKMQYITYYDSSNIIDWRSPVASLYYGNNSDLIINVSPKRYENIIPKKDNFVFNELNEHSDSLSYRYSLLIKRAFLDGAARTTYIRDDISNIEDKDTILKAQLLKNIKSDVTLDIISSIQPEQNKIIRSPINKSFIMDGCAGSGKTAVLAHRISYYVFNYPEHIKHALVIFPNDSLRMSLEDMFEILEIKSEDFIYTFESFYNSVIQDEEIIASSVYDISILNDVDGKKIIKCFDDQFDLFLKLTIASLINNDIYSELPITLDIKEYKNLESFFDDYINCINENINNLEKILSIHNAVFKFISNIDPDILELESILLKTKNDITKDINYLRWAHFKEEYKNPQIICVSILEKNTITINKLLDLIETYKQSKYAFVKYNSVKELLNILDAIKDAKYENYSIRLLASGKQILKYLTATNHRLSANPSYASADISLSAFRYNSRSSDSLPSYITKTNFYKKTNSDIVASFKELKEKIDKIPITIFEHVKHLTKTMMLLIRDNAVKYLKDIKEIFNWKHQYNLFINFVKNYDVYKYKNYKNIIAYFIYKYKGQINKKYNRIIIDEAQDIPMIDFLILRKLSNTDKPLFELYGDINQYISSNITKDWEAYKDYGVDIIYKYNKNFRNSFEICNFVNKEVGLDMEPIGLQLNEEVSIIEKEKLEEAAKEELKTYKRVVLITKHKESFKDIDLIGVRLISPFDSKGNEYNVVFVDDKDMTSNEKYISLTRALRKLYVIKR